MKNLKFKLLTLGVVTTLALSSTEAFAATTTKINTKTTTQKPIHNNFVINVLYFCTGDGVRVRSQPNTHSTILGLMYDGDLISVETEDNYVENGFHKIRYNGNVAWISEQYVCLAE